MTKLRSNL